MEVAGSLVPFLAQLIIDIFPCGKVGRVDDKYSNIVGKDEKLSCKMKAGADD